jgi:hypothetical protein
MANAAIEAVVVVIGTVVAKPLFDDLSGSLHQS